MSYFIKIIGICLLFTHINGYAENTAKPEQQAAIVEKTTIQLFQQGSYQKLLADYQGRSFVLVIWSVTCPACLSEMPLIQQLHEQNPEMNIVMLSVDGPEFQAEMQQIIQREKLGGLEHWGFAEDNSPALRYAIDSSWYGELPRAYFFNQQHFKRGVSGVLNLARYKELYN